MTFSSGIFINANSSSLSMNVSSVTCGGRILSSGWCSSASCHTS
jgi:hypothetical protein